MRILDDRSLIAMKLSADYRIARLGSVRFSQPLSGPHSGT
jgi:hypothetical protein